MEWKLSKAKDPTEWKWFCLKFTVILYWLIQLRPMITCCPTSPFPVGIFRLLNLDFLFTPMGGPVLLSALIVLSFLYLLEKWMLFTTLCWFVLCTLIISHHESNGIFERSTPLTTVMGAQFFAYLIYAFNKNFDIKKYRFQFAIQLIAATYTLSAISKLHASGLAWVNSGTLFSLQILKNHAFEYYTDGAIGHMQHGMTIVNSILQHKQLIWFMFFLTLLLEGCCFLAVFDERIRFVYGCCLVLMHIGIYMTTTIRIGGVIYPMLIFYLNPLYYVLSYFVKITDGMITWRNKTALR